MGGGYSQNVGLGLKLSLHPMPLFLECPHLGALYATCKEKDKNLVNKN
jgi:ABC-type taurine transport system ATPase subunit